MKHIIRTAGLLLMMLLLVFGCSRGDRQKIGKVEVVKDLNSPMFNVGGMIGIPASAEGRRVLPRAKFLNYSMPIDAFTAICSGKLDAVVLDRPSLEYMALSHPELQVMPGDIGIARISVAAARGKSSLMERVNDFIRTYRRDGTYRQMYERWFHSIDPKMPEIPSSFLQILPLKIGITANNEPMCFIQNGELAGFDTEFALRLGHFLRRRVEFVDLSYDALPAALAGGRIDLAVAQMDAMPERAESLLFSENYIDSPIAVLVRRELVRSRVSRKIGPVDDLNNPGMVISCEAETPPAKIVRERFPKASVLEFSCSPDCCLALKSGRANAVIYDRQILEYAAAERKDFVVLPENVGLSHIAVAAGKNQTALIGQVNDFIRRYRLDGTYRQMYQRWVQTAGAAMPSVPEPASPDGTLRIGVTSDNPPMSSFADGRFVGFDAEFAARLGLALNKRIELVGLPFNGLIPALTGGRIDLIVAQLEATPERRESVLFSDDYIDSPTAIMVRTADYLGAEFTDFSQLSGRNIGTLTGSAYDLLAKKHLPEHNVLSFSQLNQEVAALEGGKIDAFFTDFPVARFLMAQRPGLVVMPERIPCGDVALAFSKNKHRLCEKYSAEIRKMKASGELRRLQEKWFAAGGQPPQMTAPADRGKKLVVGVYAEVQPMVYMQDGQIVGYEAELAVIIANRLGYRAELRPVEAASLVESLNAGKCDLAAACIIITPEREENLLFSEPEYDGGISLVVRRSDVSSDAGWLDRLTGICHSLGESFQKTFIRESRWKLIFQGLGTTMLITLCSVLLGTVLAFPVCMMCRSRHSLISWLGERYVSLIMGTPILVILMILYYVIFAKVDISGVVVAVLAFGMDFAAYTSVTLRSGIDGVPRGQTEAALALGHRPSAAFVRFILPQAVRTMLPVYRGEVISTLKSTSIVGYIAIMDLTKMGDIIRSRTYEAFFPLIAIAAIYFLAAKLLSLLLQVLERSLDPAVRRNRLQKRGVK